MQTLQTPSFTASHARAVQHANGKIRRVFGDIMEPEKPFKALTNLERNRFTVLILDFDRDMLQFHEDILGYFGFRTKTAATFPEAIRIYKDGGVDMVICDHPMPGTTARIMLELFKRHDPHAKLVLASTLALDTLDVGALKNAGAAAVVGKPYNLNGFIAILDSQLAHSQT